MAVFTSIGLAIKDFKATGSWGAKKKPKRNEEDLDTSASSNEGQAYQKTNTQSSGQPVSYGSRPSKVRRGSSMGRRQTRKARTYKQRLEGR